MTFKVNTTAHFWVRQRERKRREEVRKEREREGNKRERKREVVVINGNGRVKESVRKYTQLQNLKCMWSVWYEKRGWLTDLMNWVYIN